MFVTHGFVRGTWCVLLVCSCLNMRLLICAGLHEDLLKSSQENLSEKVKKENQRPPLPPPFAPHFSAGSRQMGFTVSVGGHHEKCVWLDVMKPHEKCSIFCFLRELSLAAWVPGCQLPSALPPSVKPPCPLLSCSTPALSCCRSEAPECSLPLKGDSHLWQRLPENSAHPGTP